MSNKAVSTLKGIIPNILLIFCIGVVIIIFPTEPFVTKPINVITAADLSLIPCDTLKKKTATVISTETSPMHNDKKNANNIYNNSKKSETDPLIGGNIPKSSETDPLIGKKNENNNNKNNETTPLIEKNGKQENSKQVDKKTYTADEIEFQESLKNYASFIIPGTTDKECKPFKDFKASQIFTYLLFSSFKVCSNTTETMINLISKFLHIPYVTVKGGTFFPNIFFFYIFIIGVTMAFSAFINLFIPINIKIKKSSALIYDILFSLFSVLAVLYVTCLLPTIVIYIIYLMKFITDPNMIPLIKVICFFMASVTLSVFLPLILDNVKEGARNKKKKNNKNSKKKRDTKKRRDGIKSKKNKDDDAEDDAEEAKKEADKASKNAWGYLSFISIIIPVAACVFSIVGTFFSGNRNTSISKLVNVGCFGLIILVIVIFLEIYTPYVNTLLELF
jgi:hypothetical protein